MRKKLLLIVMMLIPLLVAIPAVLLISVNGILNAQNKAEIKTFAGAPALYLNGKLCPPFAYMSYLGEEKYYREAAEAGIHLYCFPAYLGDRGINNNSGIGPFRKPVWTGEGQYDFSGIAEDFRKIVAADPQAKIVIRLHLDPPLWWEQAHPDGACHLSDGSTFRQCFFSEEWKTATSTVVGDIVKWLLGFRYAGNLIGIHIAAGSTEEWFYHIPQQNDNNPARTEAFRRWLTNEYRTDKQLRAAWNDSGATLRTAVPANIGTEQPTERWRDPLKEQQAIDTYRFQAETLADNIAYFCKLVKNISKGKLLTGVFYGYHYFVFNTRNGHGALYKLLDCKYLDYISSPNDYNRAVGEDWPPMVAIRSVQLHGKLWMAENDTRTSITTLLKDMAPDIAPKGQYESGVWLGPEDMETSVALLWKNVGRMLAYGYGGWWFDMWGGWYSDPRLLDVIGSTNALYEKYPPYEEKAMRAQVAVVVDENLCHNDAGLGRLTGSILSNRYALGKTGAPYDLLLRPDAGEISPEQYKMVWLLGLLQLDKVESERIEKWRKAGITVMWTDGDGTRFFRPDSSGKDKINWTAAELRVLYAQAGVHIYNDSDDVTYAGRNWICIHSADGGERMVKLPFRAKIIRFPENKVVSMSANEATVVLPPKSTVLLRLHKVEE